MRNLNKIHISMSDSKKLLLSTFIVLLSGLITGFFSWDYAKDTQLSIFDLSLLNYLLIFPTIFVIAWIFYSRLITLLTKKEISYILNKDSLSYLPFFLFLCFPIKYRLDIPLRYIELTSQLLITFCLSGFLFAKLILCKFDLSKLKFPSQRWQYIIIVCFILVYVGLFSSLSISKHNAFGSGLFDLGNQDQAIWNTLRGRLLYMTGMGQETSRLAYHVEPILILFCPFYLIFSDVRILLFLQTLIIALGALPLFLLSKRKLNNDLAALILALAYLLYPPLEYTNLFEFHGVALVTTFFLLVFYFLEKKKYFVFFFFLLLALMCKEQISLIIFMLGLYIIFLKKQPKLGILISALGAIWFCAAMWVIIPHFNQGAESIYYEKFYGYLGSNFLEVITTIFSRPLLVLKSVFIPAKIGYLLLLFVPLGFISLFGFSILLVALPVFGINLLSSHLPQFAILSHYTSSITPFIFLSSIYGINKFIKLIGWLAKKRPFKDIFTANDSHLCLATVFFILSCSILSNHYFSPSPLSLRFHSERYRVTEHHRYLSKICKKIPEGASVSVSNNLGAHLSQRRKIYEFPDKVESADYIFVDLYNTAKSGSLLEHREKQKILVNQILSSNNYEGLVLNNQVVLLKKKSLPSPDVERDIVYEILPSFINADFNGEIILINYTYHPEIKNNKLAYNIFFSWQSLLSRKEEYELEIAVEDNQRGDIYSSSKKRFNIEGYKEIVSNKIEINLPSENVERFCLYLRLINLRTAKLLRVMNFNRSNFSRYVKLGEIKELSFLTER